MPQDFPIRPAFWNVPIWAEVGVYLVGLIAAVLCIAGIVRAIRLRNRGTASQPLNPAETSWRLRRLLWETLGQQRVMRGASGKAHFALFWGFLLLFMGTATATLDWDIGHYVFGEQFLKGRVYLAYKLTLDCAGLASVIALCFSLGRRYLWHDPKVAENTERFTVLIASLLFIILTGFLVEALRLAATSPAWAVYSPVGYALSLLFAGTSEETLRSIHAFVWVIHGLAALTFIAAIPLTYYAHLFKTPVSIFLQKADPQGAIAKIENIEEQETFGISKFDQFSRIDRARVDGCTECGRCRSVCPAVKASTALDPKLLVGALKRRLHGENSDKDLLGGIVDKQALWSCTTCGACANVCPAHVPLPDLIVMMRRHLALEQGEFPDGLATALENTQSVGNPWGMDPGSRLAWAKGLDVPIAKPGVEYDVLYWVGCSASYDRRAQKIARAMVRILRAAGINFSVMAEERCHADWARRAGEEYTFQLAAAENIENFGKYSFKRILTACPHCFNTLKHEYPQFEGAPKDVVNHVEFINELIRNARISPDAASSLPDPTVLHDACYFARYNGIVNEPRSILRKAGIELTEAENSGCNATCCGAGGSQIFMDRPGRVNVIRFKELKASGAKNIAVTCPHCLTMLESAAASEGRDGFGQIADIAEIVARGLPEAPAASSDKEHSL